MLWTCHPTTQLVSPAETGVDRSISYESPEHTTLQPLTYPSLLVKKFREGYPNFAAFLDSDESFMIYRRYGYLQSRILLEKQDELRLLEEQLDKLDCSEMHDEPDKLFMRAAQGEVRKGLLNQIESKFCEYGNESCEASPASANEMKQSCFALRNN